ncbi:MAG: hypothetical protein K0R46_1510 [Herbinix sp.]|jgi:predicted RND superfamily exporter protein|nr:hypothetical protein [Herbinix sp.]
MKENEYKVAGYVFADAHHYKEAKREEETVEYIKANTDLNDLNKVLKLYHKLVERKTLKTVIGYTFLSELRNRILGAGIVTKENLPNILIEKSDKEPRVYDNVLEKEQEQRHLTMIEDYKVKLRNSRIISIFLAIIIIIMIIIAVFSDRSMYSIYKNQVIDEYVGWQTELEAREKALEEREQALDENGISGQ